MKSLRTTLLGVTFLALAHVDVVADPFSIQPNGELVVDTAFTTHGIFTCPRSIACVGSGSSSITLSSGTSTLTLSFTGVDTSLLSDRSEKLACSRAISRLLTSPATDTRSSSVTFEGSAPLSRVATRFVMASARA